MNDAPDDPAAPKHSLLLNSLPRQSLEVLLGFAKTVVLPKDSVVYESHAKPVYGHFLLSGVAKLILPMEDGDGVECGLIGRAGMPEGLHLQGPAPVLTRCLIQAPATALRLRFDKLEELFASDQHLRALILQFNQVQASISCQVASCNALHSAEQRLARLLLMTADRTDDAVLPMTQECLGRMLGSRRTTVTKTATDWQRHGVVDYVRGQLRIVDRPRLTKIACECYRETQRVFGTLYRTEYHSGRSFSNPTSHSA